MGRRHLLSKFQVWEGMNSASPTTSVVTVVDPFDVIKYVLVVEASVIGSIEVEFSDDILEQNESWKPLDFKQQIAINGATETEYGINIKEHVCKKLRLKFINATGTGTINAWVSGSSVGA